MRNLSRNPYLYLALILIILIIIFIVTLLLTNNQQPTPESSIVPVAPSPSSFISRGPTTITPLLTQELPYNTPEEGGGIDLESSIVQQSQSQVTKILPSLPYETNFRSEDGTIISTLIPGAQFQETPWVLDVQIFGIDYQVSQENPSYQAQKVVFLKAAANIFEWLKSQGVDPEKIIISWGDKAYIREQAERWLSE